MAIIWGTPTCGSSDVAFDGEYKRLGKIGIEIVEISNSPTEVVLNINTYFSTKYGCTDSSNTYYYNAAASSATTSYGSVSISHTNNSGSGWTGNQTLLTSRPHEFRCSKTKSPQTISFSAKISGVDWVRATPTVTVTYTVPALEKYTISYNANNKTLTNALPATQDKYYGETVYVSNTVPTTVGYYCNTWMLSQTAGGTPYHFGSQYTANESAILYASWKEYTYTISYNANGDKVTNVPPNQTKKYGEDVTLVGTPVRENYNFLGWSTSPSATAAAYESGQSYNDWATVCTSQDETITLYAVWELAYVPPKITKVVVERADASGEPTDEGTHFNISFEWETDRNFKNDDGTIGAMGTCVVIKALDSDGYFAKLDVDEASKPEEGVSFDISGSGFSGIFDEIAVGPPGTDGIGPISTELSYTVYIEVRDTNPKGGTRIQRSIMPVAYPIDILAQGKGIAFGKPASKSGAFDVNFNAIFNKSVSGQVLGLGDLPILPNGTDFNSITDAGVYSVYGTASAETMVNIPYKQAGRLEVWYSTGQQAHSTYGPRRYILQRYTAYKGDVIYDRHIYADKEGTFHYEAWFNDALRAYPVNSIYISFSHDSPEDLFGGKWMRIENRFLWGVDADGTIGNIGGESTHVLTDDEMPRHQHTLLNENASGSTNADMGFPVKYEGVNKTGYGNNVNTSYAGNSKAHNNMPPYVQVSIWRRTA